MRWRRGAGGESAGGRANRGQGLEWNERTGWRKGEEKYKKEKPFHVECLLPEEVDHFHLWHLAEAHNSLSRSHIQTKGNLWKWLFQCELRITSLTYT